MSKMGRYVFELQEENQQYDYPDRKGCTDVESHPLARVTIHGDGDRGLVRRPRTFQRQSLDPSTEAESDKISKTKPATKIQRRARRRTDEGV